MTNKLTERRALQITRQIWKWVAKTGKGKGQWLGWKRVGPMMHSRPCCEYSSNEGANHNCGECPLRGFVWSEHCIHCADSPYCLYVLHTGVVRKQAASEIATACDRALVALD